MDTTSVLVENGFIKPGGNHRFSEKVIESLRPNGVEIAFDKGETIIHQGEPGKAFYVILSGEVEVRLLGEQDRSLVLTRLTPGTGFGEMGLLRKKPASADITALKRVVLLRLYKTSFHKAVAENESFRNELMAYMAKNLDNTSSEAWRFHQRAEAFNMLVHKDIPHSEPLVSKSSKMTGVEKDILSFGQEPGPVLISGETGTGKTFCARKIHNLSQVSQEESAPFIVVDCRKVDDLEANMMLFGSPEPTPDTTSLKGYGALHLAHEGTLVLQNVESLAVNVRKFLCFYLKLLGIVGEGIFPFVKIIATTDKKPEDLPDMPELLANVLRIPPLRERKADIIPLARIYLSRLELSGSRKLTKEAEHALLRLPYRHNNVKELREAIELAACFTEGDILAEHIFSGPKDKSLPLELDLGNISLVRRIAWNKGMLGFLRLGVLLGFSAIIVLCLLWSTGGPGIAANRVIWGLWEPALFFLFLFLGHIWCTVCPLSTAGIAAKKLRKGSKTAPEWIKKYSTWFVIGTFFLIIWSERVFHMTLNPFASGILLLILMSGSILFCMLYKREVFCRYICPLGALATGYAFPAAVHVRAKAQVCGGYCTTHECYKGSPETPGCPVFHHPLYISDGYNCKLCFNCLRNCPHEAVSLYMRPFLQPLWLLGGFAQAFAPFALTVYFLSLAMLAVSKTGWFVGPLKLTLVLLVAVLLGIGLNRLLPRLISGKESADKTVAARAAFALMIVGWGPLLAYQITNIPGLERLQVYAAGGGEVSLLVILQLALILFAAFLGTVAFWRIRVQAQKENISLNLAGWNILLGFTALYITLAAFITLS